ncbi:MAG: NUDIX hydrolase [Candidatus Hydrothermarchaeota archaeon]
MSGKRPLVTVDAVVEQQDRILLVRRGREPFRGAWALPGGFVEYGESTEEAAAREVMEEADVAIELEGLLGVYSDPHRDPRGHVISICYVARGRGEPMGGSDAAEARFFPLEALEDMSLAFDHAGIIRDYKRYRNVL